MSTSVAILTPKTAAAKAQLRQAATSAITNAALSYALVGAVLGLIVMATYTIHVAQNIVKEKPIVVRVNDVGRAEAVNLQWEDYKPQDTDMKYFLTQFVAGYYSRNHHTVQDMYPISLHYLREDVFQIVNRADRDTKWMAKFINSADPDVAINVTNVALDRGMESTGNYKAIVDALRVITERGGLEQRTTPIVITIWFQVHPELVKGNPNLIKFNPLGFTVYNFRADEAFAERK